jgi:hypothetical protein
MIVLSRGELQVQYVLRRRLEDTFDAESNAAE